MSSLSDPVLGRYPSSIPISNSEMQTFKDCRRKWWLNDYRGLQSKKQKTTGPLVLGTRLHAALEAYYTDGSDPVKVYKDLLARERLALTVQGHDTGEFDKEGELGRIMIEGYPEWLAESGADADLEVLGAEKKLSAPIMDGQVELIGKVDARVRRISDGVILSMDHKALHVDHGVLTPTGYRRIGDLVIGDDVLAPDGSITHVTGVYPQGEVDLFDVIFSDKTLIRACAEHQWQTWNSFKGNEVLSTQEIAAGLNKFDKMRRSVPLIQGSKVNFESSTLPLHPYTLGILLGDGSRRTSSFCSWDTEIIENVRKNLFEGQSIIVYPNYGKNKTGYFIVIKELLKSFPEDGDKVKRSPINRWLKSVGLWDCYSYEKFIPEQYLYTSYEDRLSLLRGLMDTDGNVRRSHGQTLFVTTSSRLRDNVMWLVRSLGGISTSDAGRSSTCHFSDGTKKICRTVYNISIQFPDGTCPFKLSRKANLWQEKRSKSAESGRRIITNIRPSGRGEAVCISVDHPDRLYVTDNFTVTHNTLASFDSITKIAHMAEQPLHYHLLELLTLPEGERSDGMRYNMLKKSKRTAKATPPFYDRLDVHHNRKQLESYWIRLHGVISDMLEVRRRLDAGEDHRVVAYPRPTQECVWKCPFFAVCPMFDDGSAAEEFIQMQYEQVNPLERYEEENTRISSSI